MSNSLLTLALASGVACTAAWSEYEWSKNFKPAIGGPGDAPKTAVPTTNGRNFARAAREHPACLLEAHLGVFLFAPS